MATMQAVRLETKKKDGMKYCEETLQFKTSLEEGFLALGERLKNIRDGRFFEPQWSSFDEFVAEMKMSKGTASKLINLYEKFVLQFGVTAKEIGEAGGWSNLAEWLPVVKNRGDALEAIHLAKTLSREDNRKEVHERKTGIPMAACAHQNTYTIDICRDCGDKILTHESNTP